MSETPRYQCPFCTVVSYNPNDIRERYCGACRRFGYDTPVDDSGKVTPAEPLWEEVMVEKHPWVATGDHVVVDNAFISGGVVSDTPVFPFTVNFAGTQVRLHADGTWEGDIVAFKQAAKDFKGLLYGDQGLLIWLLLRQMMRDDERFW